MNLEHFLASRTWYTRGRRVAAAQMLVAVLVPFCSSMVLLWWSTQAVKAWIAFFGISAALAEAVVFDPFERRYRGNGAKEQQVFDSAVLQLPWPSCIAGSPPGPEATAEAIKACTPAETAIYENWYPAQVASLDLPLARILCQRCNSWWDSKMRSRYAAILLVLVVLIGALVVAMGLARRSSSEDLILTIYAPISPLVLWSLREEQRHREAAESSGRIHAHADRVWDQATKKTMSSDQISQECREMQAAIYQRRDTAPFVPNAIQARQRKSYLKLMLAGVDDMIARAKRDGYIQ